MWSGRTRWVTAAGLVGLLCLLVAQGRGSATAVSPPGPEGPFRADRLLLRFDPAADAAARQRVLAAVGGQAVGEIAALGVVVVAVPDPGRALRAGAAEAGLLAAEPDYVARIMDEGPRPFWRIFAPTALVSDDPRTPEQWHLALIGTDQAWRVTRGAGVVIAIVDTGVDCLLDDLAGQCVAGYDFMNDDADPADDHGHGTDVAAIAAAAARNGIGGMGVAPDARIMPLKAMAANGFGSHAGIAAAIVWAVDHGAQVVNLSLGGYYDSSTLRAAVAYAQERGVVVVAAAGNDSVEMPTWPAAYPGVIGVAATDRADAHWRPSNSGEFVDLSAPGAGVATSTLNGWGSRSGTSEATPIVAGIAALLVSQAPSRTPEEVLGRLAASAVDLGAPGWDPLFGHGRVDAAGALAP